MAVTCARIYFAWGNGSTAAFSAVEPRCRVFSLGERGEQVQDSHSQWLLPCGSALTPETEPQGTDSVCSLPGYPRPESTRKGLVAQASRSSSPHVSLGGKDSLSLT